MEVSPEKSAEVFLKRLVWGNQYLKDRAKGVSEFSCGFIELSRFGGFLVPTFSQEVVKVSSSEKAENARNRNTDGKVDCNHWRYLVIGFSIGGWLVIFVDHFLPLIRIYARTDGIEWRRRSQLSEP